MHTAEHDKIVDETRALTLQDLHETEHYKNLVSNNNFI